MANTVIQLKKSSTPSSVPSSLANGELAINFADGKLFYKNTAGFIAEISGSGGGGGGNNSFGTVNASGTLIVADTSSDVLTLIAGSGISITGDAINDTITISATGGGGGGNGTPISILDEGVYVTNNVTSIDFVGSGVAVTNTGNAVTVTVSGGGGGSSITTEIVSGTTQTAVKDYRYILANTSATTVTLPGSPLLGDTLYIVVANELANNVIARNGNKIMSLNEDLTLDIVNTAIGFVYTNSTLGWRLI